MKLIYSNFNNESKFSINISQIQDPMINTDKILEEFTKVDTKMYKYLKNHEKIKEINKENKELLTNLREDFNEFIDKEYPEYQL